MEQNPQLQDCKWFPFSRVLHINTWKGKPMPEGYTCNLQTVEGGKNVGSGL